MKKIVLVWFLLGSTPMILSSTAQAEETVAKEDAAISVTVIGNANAPGVVQIAHPTLIKVIAISRGWTRNADLRKVVILRKKSDGGVEKIVVDLSAVLDGERSDPILQDQDIVHIPERPL